MRATARTATIAVALLLGTACSNDNASGGNNANQNANQSNTNGNANQANQNNGNANGNNNNPGCGDGVLEGNEACDDGGANSDTQPDACRTDCTLPTCGDGVIDTGELCDDGNTVSGDGCSGDCASDEICGNGIVDATLGEECDDGDTTPGDGCSPACLLEICGNGIVDPGELCDDGDLLPGSGCDPFCLCVDVDGDDRGFGHCPAGFDCSESTVSASLPVEPGSGGNCSVTNSTGCLGDEVCIHPAGVPNPSCYDPRPFCQFRDDAVATSCSELRTCVETCLQSGALPSCYTACGQDSSPRAQYYYDLLQTCATSANCYLDPDPFNCIQLNCNIEDFNCQQDAWP